MLKQTIYLILMALVIFPVVGAAGYAEFSISKSSSNYILFGSGSNILAFSKEGELMWSFFDEDKINDLEIIEDVNGNGYQDILIGSQSFIVPSTKIIDGKQGKVIKTIPITKKTYKNNYPTPTTKILKNNGRTFFSNFNNIYESINGEINKVINAGNYIINFGVLGNNFVIITPQKIVVYDLNFNKIKEKSIKTGQEKYFLTSNFIVQYKLVYSARTTTEFTVYDSRLNKYSSFSLQKTLVSAISDKIILVDEFENKFYIYNTFGSEETKLDTTNQPNIDDEQAFIVQDKQLKVLKDNELKYIADVSNISLDSSSKIAWFDNSLILTYSNNNVNIYKNNKLVGTFSIDKQFVNLNLDSSKFIISKNWPFSYKYKQYSGTVDDTKLQNVQISRLEEINDINNDGVKEVLVLFGSGIDINSLGILYPKTSALKQISFQVSPAEQADIIDDIINKISSVNNSINSNFKSISEKQTKFNELQTKLAAANASDKPAIEKNIISVREDVTKLENKNKVSQDELFKLQNEKIFWESSDIGKKMQISSYAYLGNKIFILLYSGHTYEVSLATFEKNKVEIKDGNIDFYFSFTDGTKDINNDGVKEVLVVSNDKFGIVDGAKYNLIKSKIINGTYFIQQHKYIIGNNIILFGGNKILRYRVNDLSVVNEESFNNLQFTEILDSEHLLYYSERAPVLVDENNNVILDFLPNYLNPGKDSVLIYNCGGDERKDVVVVGSDGSSNLKLYCIDKISKSVINSYDIVTDVSSSKSNIVYEKGKFNQNIDIRELKNIDIAGNYLIIKSSETQKYGTSGEAFRPTSNILVDLNDYKIKIISLMPLSIYDSKIYSNDVELSKPQSILNLADNAYFKGDFNIQFTNGDLKLIYADNQFYTSTLGNSEDIKLSAGQHNLIVLSTIPGTTVSNVDYLTVNISRSTSISQYIIALILISFLAIGSILKWKRMKR